MASAKRITQKELTRLEDLDFNTLYFSDPTVDKKKNKRLNVGRVLPNGEVSELLIVVPNCFSYGVSEIVEKNEDKNAPKKVVGYNLPLCLWEREGPTDEQLQWSKQFEELIKRCKEAVVEKRRELQLGSNFTADKLDKFHNCYYRKKDENGDIDEKSPPTLYPKLYPAHQKRYTSIVSKLVGNKTVRINPFSADVLGKYCRADAIIKVESIFLGAVKNIQVKLYEARLEMNESEQKSFFGAQESTDTVVVGNNDAASVLGGDDEDENNSTDTGATDNVIVDEDEEVDFDAVEVDPPKPTPVAKPVAKKTAPRRTRVTVK